MDKIIKSEATHHNNLDNDYSQACSGSHTDEYSHEHFQAYSQTHSHGHGHSHNISGMSGVKMFWTAVLNLLIAVTELAGGLFSGSLALVSDSLHNFSDTASILLSYFALKISKKPKNAKMTYGYKRSQILAAFINSSVLLALSLFLIFEALRRFNNPEHIKGNMMIIVAAIGLIANIIGVLLLSKDSRDNINIKSSYLHLLSDAVSSVGVVAGGVVIKLWHIYWIDPVITILIAFYIIRETWSIIRKTMDILMQSSADMDYIALKQDIERIHNVINIHHVHTWYCDEKTIFFEAHIILKDILLSQTGRIYDKISRILKDNYGVNHITIQFETDKTNCSKDMFNVKIDTS